MPKYKELYPTSLSDGIGLLSGLTASELIPWHTPEVVDQQAIERAFVIAHGNKLVIDDFAGMSLLSQINTLTAMFVQKWTKLWNAYKVEYNIMDAYIVHETGSHENKFDKSESFTHGKKMSTTENNGGTVQVQSSGSNSENVGLYGFNSGSSVPSDTSSGSDSNIESETRDLHTTSNTSNSGTDTRVNDDSDNGSYKIDKTGNIGSVTPQELVRQELELWGEPYFKVVFNDIVKFCMIQVYQ